MKKINYKIFWGDRTTCTADHRSSSFFDWCETFTEQNNLNSLTILKQTHSNDGFVIKNSHKNSIFENEGDYLITNQLHVGIGVLTADCLPIIAIDTKNNAFGIAHAGWRGSIAGIALKMIQHMHHEFSTNIEDLVIHVGPAARSCCYEVQPDFLNKLNPDWIEACIVKKDSKLFFDSIQYNLLQLTERGIQSKQVVETNQLCTLCNPNFHSFRRDGTKSLRQLSAVWL